jgi:hypothetical protein
MNKITADHLARRACVYIRQSTPDQVRHNLESQGRQYALAERARALGWQDIDMIDDDLGVSGSGTHRRGSAGVHPPLFRTRDSPLAVQNGPSNFKSFPRPIPAPT